MKVLGRYIRRDSIKKELEEARDDATKETSAMYEERIKNLTKLLKEEHQLRLSAKDAKISSLQKANNDLQAVARDAAALSLRAVHFVQSVKQFADEDAYQSHQMMEAVASYHQSRLRIAEESNNLSQEATRELESDRHRLIAGL